MPNYRLYTMAEKAGYPEWLCLLLHYREVECLNYFVSPSGSYPFIGQLESAVSDKVQVDDVVRMALGQYDYCLEADDIPRGKDYKEFNRELAIEDGQDLYDAYVRDGRFDHEAYMRALLASHNGGLAVMVSETSHHL